MINGFFEIITEDFIKLSNMQGKSADSLSDQEKSKIAHAAMRVLAGLGMVFSALKGVQAFLGNHLFKVILYSALYAVTHDIFLISLNSEKALLGKVVLEIKALWNYFTEMCSGKKSSEDAPSHPYTEGTFFRTMWDIHFNSL